MTHYKGYEGKRIREKITGLTAVLVVAPEVRGIYVMQSAAPAIVEPNLIWPGAYIGEITFCTIWKQFFDCSQSIFGEITLSQPKAPPSDFLQNTSHIDRILKHMHQIYFSVSHSYRIPLS